MLRKEPPFFEELKREMKVNPKNHHPAAQLFFPRFVVALHVHVLLPRYTRSSGISKQWLTDRRAYAGNMILNIWKSIAEKIFTNE